MSGQFLALGPWSRLAVQPDPGAARELVRQELQRREYEVARPSLLARVAGWVLQRLSDALDAAASVAPGGVLGLIALIVLLGLLVAVVLVRLGPLARDQSDHDLFQGSAPLTAAEHRRRADAAAADGHHAEAVRERLRAVVRDLEHRGALDPRPGRTAGEVARDGGAALPAAAADLQRATSVFDEVWYGGHQADAASYATMVEVDHRVAALQVVVPA